jgi:hypothetical protein
MTRKHLLAGIGLALATLSLPTYAADPVKGKALFWTTNGSPLSCGSGAGCHGGFPDQRINGIDKGVSAQATIDAIVKNKGGMLLLTPYVSQQDAEDIAAYIANPAAGMPAPQAALAPMTLAFGNQTQSIASAPLTATLSNAGSAPLTLSNVTLGGMHSADFTRSGTCGAGTTVAAGASCSVVVSFTPLAVGARTGNVTITHNASGGSTNLALTGTGVAAVPVVPVVSLSPSAQTFGTLVVGMSSAAKAVSLANTGNAPLQLTALQLGGNNPADFAYTTNCPVNGSLAAGASCSINVAFTPSAIGARSALLSVVSNAMGAPNVSLSGIGSAPSTPPAPVTPPTPGTTDATLQLSATMLSFKNRRLDQDPTGPQKLRLTNMGTMPVSILNIAVTGDYSQTNTTCGASLAAGHHCDVHVVFYPTAIGPRAGELVITTNAAGSPHRVALMATGTAPKAAKTSGGYDNEDCEEGEDEKREKCSALNSPLGKPKKK